MKYKVLVAIAVSFLLSIPAGSKNLRLLVGTYTENTGAEGVYLYSFDTETAACKLVGCSPAGNPSFVIASPDGKTAYSVNEFNDGRQAVSSFALCQCRL